MFKYKKSAHMPGHDSEPYIKTDINDAVKTQTSRARRRCPKLMDANRDSCKCEDSPSNMQPTGEINLSSN